ncbi:hypothetical protein J9246_12010 [Micrococcus luteus]|nr:hypothetical protein [Micrococcus luteus]MBS9538445.1 hypothetical protein [Micrococcus luteus]
MKKVEHVHATYDTPHLNAAVGVFALLANPVSVKMILAIRDIEVSANHLADIVDLPVDQTSHELPPPGVGRDRESAATRVRRLLPIERCACRGAG